MTQDLEDIDLTTDTVENDEDDGGGSGTYVSCQITDTTGRSTSVSTITPGEVTDEEMARMLLRVALGAAQMRGAGTWMALQLLITSYGNGSD